MKSKKLATLGLLAGTAVGGGLGLALQSTGSAGAAAVVAVDDSVPTDGADTTDTGTDSGRPDPSTRLAEVLAPLVEDGTLTQAQADKVIETLVAARPEGGQGGPGGHGGHGRGPGRHLDGVAETIGITVEELRTALQDGQTVAEIAAANGSSGQAVIDALLVDAKTHLDEEVAAGELTAEEAATKLADITERLTTFVNETPQPGEGGRGPGRGPGREADSTDDTDDTTVTGS